MHHLRRNSLPHKEELCRQLENYHECQQSSDCHPQRDETKDEEDRLQSGKFKKNLEYLEDMYEGVFRKVNKLIVD